MRTFTAVPATTRPATASSANAPEVASPMAGTFFADLVAADVGNLEGHNARVLGGGNGHDMAISTPLRICLCAHRRQIAFRLGPGNQLFGRISERGVHSRGGLPGALLGILTPCLL